MILLNLTLLALAGVLVWILRTNWIEAQARERTVLLRRVEPKTVLAPPTPPAVKAAAPAEYIDVANKMLFSADRNPTVVVEPPKPAPQPVMPALPDYNGQMSIGEPPVILLSMANGAQRSYQTGEQVGDFKLVSFDQEKAIFEWKGKMIERRLDDLRPKQTMAQAAPAPPPAPVSAPAKSVASLDRPNAAPAATASPASPAVNSVAPPIPAKATTSLGGSSTAKTNDSSATDTAGDEFFGPVLAGGVRACVTTDNSPPGTVHSGYRKVQVMTMVGALCSWEQVK
jgi:hypothetical protein